MRSPILDCGKSCLLCGYDLQGIPADHACPECGLPRALDALRYAEMRGPRLLYLLLFLWLTGLAAALLRTPCVMVIWLAYWIYALISEGVSTRRKDRVRVIIHPSGVVLLHPPHTWRLHQWEGIGSLRHVVWNGAVIIRDRHGAALENLPAARLGGWYAARSFVNAASACLSTTNN